MVRVPLTQYPALPLFDIAVSPRRVKMMKGYQKPLNAAVLYRSGSVCVWGWSGGGTNTLNLMFRSPDLYKVGVVVAAVPDQKLYDTLPGALY